MLSWLIDILIVSAAFWIGFGVGSRHGFHLALGLVRWEIQMIEDRRKGDQGNEMHRVD